MFANSRATYVAADGFPNLRRGVVVSKEVRVVAPDGGFELGQERFVGRATRSNAFLIEDGDYAFVFLFNKLTDNLNEGAPHKKKREGQQNFNLLALRQRRTAIKGRESSDSTNLLCCHRSPPGSTQYPL